MGDTLGDPGLKVSRLDEIGYYALPRLNTLRGPTANQRIRQAILAGIDQTAVMETVLGADSGRFRTPVGQSPPDSEFVTTSGNDRIGATQSPRAIKARLKDAGYKGEPIVILNPVDDVVHARLTRPVIDEMTQIGLSVDERKPDREMFEAWRLWAQRGNTSEAGQRANPSGAGKDGNTMPTGDDWSAPCDSLPCADHYDPFAISTGRAPPAGPSGGPSGGGPSGGMWPGWPDDPSAGRPRETWIDSSDPRARRDIVAQPRARVFTTAAFVPLGQWFPTAAWRTTVTGQQKGPFPVFWDIART